jgi:hypothetical protein
MVVQFVSTCGAFGTAVSVNDVVGFTLVIETAQ